MKRIIFQNESGGVSVIIPSGELSIEQVAKKDVPAGVPYEIVDVSEVPSDRTFRDAWVMGDCCIDHDLDKCKAIGHDRRRAARAEEFTPYDEIIAKHTGQPIEKVAKDTERDYFMSAPEAQEYGIVDRVIESH